MQWHLASQVHKSRKSFAMWAEGLCRHALFSSTASYPLRFQGVAKSFTCIPISYLASTSFTVVKTNQGTPSQLQAWWHSRPLHGRASHFQRSYYSVHKHSKGFFIQPAVTSSKSQHTQAASTHKEATRQPKESIAGGVNFLSIPLGGVDETATNECATPGSWAEHLVYYDSFYELFLEHATQASVALWGQGQGPFSDLQGQLSWLSPNLGPRASELRESCGGIAPELFGFMMCFPQNEKDFKATTDLVLSIFLIDDWIEQQSKEEAEQLADWWRILRLESEDGLAYESGRAFEAFPATLKYDPNVQKGAQLCCTALAALSERVDSDWFGRFAWTHGLYAKGVASEVQLSAFTTPPHLSEYFAYRCFSSAFIPLAVWAACLNGIQLNENRYDSAFTLLVCASLVACCFNDAFVASKDAAADGPVNLTAIVGRRRAVDIHNVLVDLLCEEADAWLGCAVEDDDSQRFVNLLKASTFGCQLWHNICPRYRKYLRTTGQRFGILYAHVGTLSENHKVLKDELRVLVRHIASTNRSAEATEVL